MPQDLREVVKRSVFWAIKASLSFTIFSQLDIFRVKRLQTTNLAEGMALVSSSFGQYLVGQEHVETLNIIFQQHPGLDQGFLPLSISVRSFYMNLLAEISNAVDNTKFQGVPDVVEAINRVKDLEREGFDLTWLKEKIELIRGHMLETSVAAVNELALLTANHF
ncbi:hypothetical protein V6N13_111335 [Hibiscus sabdariffa]|uniref:Uncharacterized protein n=1 Tax=Hibiscus sabdariffa TaxID=183260 RepID=A0ABR2TJW6_9ROSI